ncbi:MAG: 1-acyl-sn-glycerol-3-phosphate acyltransferase [Acidobacteria bacterium]|nr:1-acyl-sn-glycerol-3-phosphate acyltransferase [Acidobacteriota bacterium]
MAPTQAIEPADTPVTEKDPYARPCAGLGWALALGTAAVASTLLFRIFNRTRVEGRENLPQRYANVLYCLNHNSLIDNFAFGSQCFMRRMLLEPESLPYNLADRRNFFGDPESPRLKDKVLHLLGKHFFGRLRAYPVDRKKGDLSQVDRWADLLRDNSVVVFPEGTRSRTGDIGPGKLGVGKLIYMARPTVIPVFQGGTEKILGVGARLPRPFNTLHIRIGQALDLSDLIDPPLPAEEADQFVRYKAISDRVIGAIRALEPDEVPA